MMGSIDLRYVGARIAVTIPLSKDVDALVHY
jgi:hypothetical protein